MRKPRVAVLSVHTSPMDQPGSGDSGGMNVYIRAVAERLADHEVEVDLFTRCRGADTTTGRAPSLTVNGPSSPKSTTSTFSSTVPAAVPADRGHTPNTFRSLPGAVSHR